MTKILYTAEAHVTGGRLAGHGRTTDGALEVDIRIPKDLGGEGGGTNPEQLFAVGFAACFESALAVVARREKVEAGDAEIDSKVHLLPAPEKGFALAVQLDVSAALGDGRRGGHAHRGGCTSGLPVLERHPRKHRRHADGERRAGRLGVTRCAS